MIQPGYAHTLPSLNGLKAFEASGRFLSFTLASRELHVTQGAVSRQVRALEEELGIPLFNRLHRRITLTEQGQVLLETITGAFEKIAQTVVRIKTQPRDLTIKVHPTFAIRWLIPRIHRFQGLHPEIQVRLTTSSENVDFSRDCFDVGITYNPRNVPGILHEILLKERLTPVCSPALLEKGLCLRTPRDLKPFRLLHNNPDQREWRAWARAAGVMDLAFEKGQIFEIDDSALQAATAGLGIALGDLLLISDDIRSKRLVQPFDYLPVETGAYFLSYQALRAGEPGITAFKNWLFSEMTADISLD
ncbi:MAG: transcriptional regulator GcvA [Pseudomonadota bacterium]